MARTVSPDIEAEFTSLALSQEIILLSSLQSLYLLSKPSGEILSTITPHTTSIHLVRSLRESMILATSAVGDRFIAVISIEENSFHQMGSLVCTHDVRTFIIHDDTLMAITDVGGLEIFRSFSANFNRSKKRGLTKAPDVEIHLTTSHLAKLEVQNVTVRGSETIISWIEGAKTGFKTIDISSMSGKVELNIETRKEHAQQMVHLPQVLD